MAARRAGSLTPWLGIALAVIVLDQITKAMIVAAFQLGDARRVTPFFDIVRAHNRGAAFSFLNDASGWQRWFFIGLGLAAAVFIVWLLARHGGQRMFGWALALILGGALGNVIDRRRSTATSSTSSRCTGSSTTSRRSTSPTARSRSARRCSSSTS